MTPFNDGDQITQLPCGHLFSTDAIKVGLENKEIALSAVIN